MELLSRIYEHLIVTGCNCSVLLEYFRNYSFSCVGDKDSIMFQAEVVPKTSNVAVCSKVVDLIADWVGELPTPVITLLSGTFSLKDCEVKIDSFDDPLKCTVSISGLVYLSVGGAVLLVLAVFVIVLLVIYRKSKKKRESIVTE